jgi:hypothetical protein
MRRNTFHSSEQGREARPRREARITDSLPGGQTINHSQKERDSWYKEPPLTCTTSLTRELKKKIEDAYRGAISQLTAPSDAQAPRKIVLLILDADYTFDPVDSRVAHAVLDYLNLIERGDFEIICHVRSPWN